MFALISIPNGDTATVDTEAKYPLGVLFGDNALPPSTAKDARQGPSLWRYVFNDDAATNWAVGTVIAREAEKGPGYGRVAPVNTPSDRVIGVAQHAIAFGSYGWILAYGVGEVLAGTETIDKDEGVYVSSATAGAGMEAGTPVTASNTTVTEAHLAGPFASALEDAAAAATAACLINCL